MSVGTIPYDCFFLYTSYEFRPLLPGWVIENDMAGPPVIDVSDVASSHAALSMLTSADTGLYLDSHLFQLAPGLRTVAPKCAVVVTTMEATRGKRMHLHQ